MEELMAKQFHILYEDAKVSGNGKEMSLSNFHGSCNSFCKKKHRTTDSPKDKSEHHKEYEKHGSEKGEHR